MSANTTNSTAINIVSLKTINSGPLLVLVFPATSAPPKALPREPSDCCSNISAPSKTPRII